MLISQLVLLAVVSTLAVVVVSLYRQIGVLHERTAPADGLLTQTVSANQIPDMGLRSVAGATLTPAMLQPGRPLPLLFVAPGCSVCEKVVGECVAAGVDLTYVASDFSSAPAHAGVADERWLVSLPLALALGVDRTPSLVVLDEARTSVLTLDQVGSAREVERVMQRFAA